MSIVIGLSVFLGLLSGGLAYFLFRRRLWASLTAGILVFAASSFWLLTPVCVPIPTDTLANFNPPIETRTDTGMMGQRYFQRRNGVWHHCKVRIARMLFF